MANDNSSRWMPTASGVLNIISSILGFFTSLILFITAPVFSYVYNNYPESIEGTSEALSLVATICVIVGIVLVIPCVVSLIGGIFAIKRKRWGWALAGSICSALVSNVFGIVAIVFVAMSKKEFTS
ncbi:MAG: hypothetical protein FWH51_01915 [Dehalococcoidia bacterium]|nr:hypothetical protein [Dehalococcoidia bacterium]